MSDIDRDRIAALPGVNASRVIAAPIITPQQIVAAAFGALIVFAMFIS